jgi:hypothetical protein
MKNGVQGLIHSHKTTEAALIETFQLMVTSVLNIIGFLMIESMYDYMITSFVLSFVVFFHFSFSPFNN